MSATKVDLGQLKKLATDCLLSGFKSKWDNEVLSGFKSIEEFDEEITNRLYEKHGKTPECLVFTPDIVKTARKALKWPEPPVPPVPVSMEDWLFENSPRVHQFLRDHNGIGPALDDMLLNWIDKTALASNMVIHDKAELLKGCRYKWNEVRRIYGIKYQMARMLKENPIKEWFSKHKKVAQLKAEELGATLWGNELHKAYLSWVLEQMGTPVDEYWTSQYQFKMARMEHGIQYPRGTAMRSKIKEKSNKIMMTSRPPRAPRVQKAPKVLEAPKPLPYTELPQVDMALVDAELKVKCHRIARARAANLIMDMRAVLFEQCKKHPEYPPSLLKKALDCALGDKDLEPSEALVLAIAEQLVRRAWPEVQAAQNTVLERVLGNT